jgi:hypothetical protein
MIGLVSSVVGSVWVGSSMIFTCIFSMIVWSSSSSCSGAKLSVSCKRNSLGGLSENECKWWTRSTTITSAEKN